MMAKQSYNTHAVVERTFEIINLLIERRSVGVTELANEFDIPKTTAHTYLKTLENTGHTINKNGEYYLSFRLLHQAGKMRHKSSLYRVGRNEVDKLARKVGEAVNLGICEGTKRILIYSAEGEDAVWDDVPIGSRTPLNLTAMGKAILAFRSDEFLDYFVGSGGIGIATKHSIRNREDLIEDIERIRERGYSIEDNEHIIGVQAFGVPILSDNEEVIGAISVAGPTSRLNSEKIESELVEQLREHANVIELKLERY